MRPIRRSRSIRLPRSPRKALLFVVLLMALAALQQWRPELFQRAASRPLEPGTYRVARVVDGDTLVLADPA